MVKDSSIASVRANTDDNMKNIYRELRGQFIFASFGALLVGAAFLIMPDSLTVGPVWLPLALEVVLFLPIAYSLFISRLPIGLLRVLRFTVQIVITLALVSSVILLIAKLPQFNGRGGMILRPGAILWISNIAIFAGWYWELDGDGPTSRHTRNHTASDFQFPQQQNGRSWAAGFVDYLFLAFCFATALSPADTTPLTHRAKLLMMAQALISLLIITIIISRSINIL